MRYDITQKATKSRLTQFAEELHEISSRAGGLKFSSRGWCYLLEGEGFVTKAEFDRVETLINSCRRKGILAIDFIAEEEGRQFGGVEIPDDDTPVQYMRRFIDAALRSEEHYTPNWWKEEEYYIQIVVEKIDLKTLFTPVCEEYHIPIATTKGWSSMLQRAIYARRFQQAEEMGLKPVLLYCGDHDPDGLRISEFLRKNIGDLKNIRWEDGGHGYDPENLEIVRFGLDADFIERHNLTWINNLITGSGGHIAIMRGKRIVQGKTKNGKPHPNFKWPYVKAYLKKFGVKKCEANAIVTKPTMARNLVEGVIKGFVGEGALKRFEKRRQEIRDIVNNFRDKTGLNKSLKVALKKIDRGEEEDE